MEPRRLVQTFRDSAAMRPLREFFLQARRDVRVLSRSVLFGDRPSPVVSRTKSCARSEIPAPPVESALPGRRVVKVTRVERETADATSLHLVEQDGSPLRFTPGQFLTLEVSVKEGLVRRAYSLIAGETPEDSAHITIKRIANGMASSLLCDTVQPGAELWVRGPSGNFTLPSDDIPRAGLVMIAGGSGVTPILSIAQEVLRTQSQHAGGPRITLVYGNRGIADVIFRERLARLADAHPSRLIVDHVLSDPPSSWTGGVGMLDSPTLRQRFDALGISRGANERMYFVCGPTPMMEAARRTLGELGVSPSRIREELFSRPEARATQLSSPAAQTLSVLKNGNVSTLVAAPGKTILDAALDAGIDMPFSCAMGGCGACRVRLSSGSVDMAEPNCLSQAERRDGYVLTCVGRATSPVVLEVDS